MPRRRQRPGRHPQGHRRAAAARRLQPARGLPRRADLRPERRQLSRAAARALHRLQPARPDAGARQGLSKKLLVLPPHPGARVRRLPHGQRGAAAEAARLPAHRQVAHQGRLRRHRAGVARRRRRQARRARALHPRALGTDAIVERYIDGRELYVGVLGNQRLQVFPVWELLFTKMPDELPHIATERVKWDAGYQQEARHQDGARQGPARRRWSTHIQHLCKRIYRTLELSGYARIDLRLDAEGPGVRAGGQPESAARLRRGLRRVGRARRASIVRRASSSASSTWRCSAARAGRRAEPAP